MSVDNTNILSEEKIKPRSTLFVIMGDPVPLARARVGNGKFYDSQIAKKMAYRFELESRLTAQFALQKIPFDGFFRGPLLLEVIFYFPKPKKAKRYAQHCIKPDLSNLIKFLEDVCTGILYKDDCLISSIIAKKVYDMAPRTEFTITELTRSS